MTPAHLAVENEDLPRLRELLDGGVDIEEIDDGLTLLQHAVDVESMHTLRRATRFTSTSQRTSSPEAQIHLRRL